MAWTHLLLQIQESFGEYAVKGPSNPDLECKERSLVLKDSPPSELMLTGHQCLLAFSSLSKPHPEPPSDLENTVSELLQQFSTFRILNLIPISPRGSFLLRSANFSTLNPGEPPPLSTLDKVIVCNCHLQRVSLYVPVVNKRASCPISALLNTAISVTKCPTPPHSNGVEVASLSKS